MGPWTQEGKRIFFHANLAITVIIPEIQNLAVIVQAPGTMLFWYCDLVTMLAKLETLRNIIEIPSVEEIRAPGEIVGRDH